VICNKINDIADQPTATVMRI